MTDSHSGRDRLFESFDSWRRMVVDYTADSVSADELLVRFLRLDLESRLKGATLTTARGIVERLCEETPPPVIDSAYFVCQALRDVLPVPRQSILTLRGMVFRLLPICAFRGLSGDVETLRAARDAQSRSKDSCQLESVTLGLHIAYLLAILRRSGLRLRIPSRGKKGTIDPIDAEAIEFQPEFGIDRNNSLARFELLKHLAAISPLFLGSDGYWENPGPQDMESRIRELKDVVLAAMPYLRRTNPITGAESSAPLILIQPDERRDLVEFLGEISRFVYIATPPKAPKAPERQSQEVGQMVQLVKWFQEAQGAES